MKKIVITSLILLVVCAVLWAATGDEYATLTSSVERRQLEPLIKPVWEHVITWTYDTDDSGAETYSIPINGILLKVILSLPDTTTNGTTTQLLIKDNGDITIFDSGEQAEGTNPSDIANYTFNLYEPLTGTIDIIIEPSTSPSTNGVTPVVTLRGI